MALRIDILTLFPEMFGPFLNTSIPRRAADKGLVEYHLTNLRDFATDKHQSVDDKPFGGGPGMVMMCQTMFDAVEAIEQLDREKGADKAVLPQIAEGSAESEESLQQTQSSAKSRPVRRVLLTPQGRVLDQALAIELAAEERLLLIAGRYEGFDQRIVDGLDPLELSIGDYVLSGGELAAMVVIDAVVRLLPGALGAEGGAADESFADGLLEHPQYTRPREFRGMPVPDVLLSGDHKVIEQWRATQRQERTKQRRPDLWQAFVDRKNQADPDDKS